MPGHAELIWVRHTGHTKALYSGFAGSIAAIITGLDSDPDAPWRSGAAGHV